MINMEPERLERILELLYKHKLGEISSDEAKDLQRWISASPMNARLLEELEDAALFRKEMALQQGFDAQKSLTQFYGNLQPQRSWTFPKIWYYAAVTVAAALLIVALTLHNRSMGEKASSESSAQAAIVPGGNKASLVLANGERIELHESEEGIVFGDSVHYSNGKAVAGVGKPEWLTLVTPKGGIYKLTLADGTKVVLNADSKLKYQRVVDHQDRSVYLDGEAYFEVTKRTRALQNNSKTEFIPFRVLSGHQEVKVLGTSFNMKAYEHENTSETTLIEGLVNVHNRDSRGAAKAEVSHLQPGQQASWINGKLHVKQVDVNQYTAWKEGKFVFESQKLVNIMQTLARWYDVEVVFEGPKEQVLFTGSMDRQVAITDILDKITGTQQVRFRIEGRRIIVM